MSNIPPEPPDPPGNISQVTHNTTSNHLDNINRYGRNRQKGPRRNAGGHSERAPPSTTTGQESVQPAGNSDSRQRRPKRRTKISPPEGVRNGERSHNSKDIQGDNTSHLKLLDSSDAGQRLIVTNENEVHGDEQKNSVSKPGIATRNQGRSRKGQFGSQLTKSRTRGSPSSSRRPQSPPQNSDLTTRLTFALRAGPPHPDCPICFNPIYSGQPTWSCSLSAEASSSCWTIFHLKCVREWAKKNALETKEAFVARGEVREGEWRCPGCQTKRIQVPQNYICFCGAVTDPKPGISTPHSCGMPCSRERASCEHPCPLTCHPGPCPPCVLTVNTSCYCSKTKLSIRCGHFNTQPPPSLSCGQICTHILSCGVHTCDRECHPEECAPCESEESIYCYCGKSSKTVNCGEHMTDRMECSSVGQDGKKITWDGRFDCGSKCERPFICGSHACSKTCHPPSLASQCPFDPSVVTHCPCGKHALRELSAEPRSKCTDPIQTCASICAKRLEGCNHSCSAPCHVGDCPPCDTLVTHPCRCGSKTRSMPCHERQRDTARGNEIILCDRVCGALRLCGRHQCSRTCCPLANFKTSKGKKRAIASQQVIVNPELDDAEKQWHECDLFCGKTLSCGSHKCEEIDHRGPCPPCLRSSFEELICHCTRTVLFPPVPCGTQIICTHPCDRLPPPCGHGRTLHNCHEDPDLCPPCPFLTTKSCACGKVKINNVRCSQQKISCGQSCGKLLDCGFHRCQKLCHDDACGPCSSICGKPRKLCVPFRHSCVLLCHAPSACDESQACDTMITASCPCGRFKQQVKCGRCTSHAERLVPQLQCRDECHIAKRNARLADALGISPEAQDKRTASYSEDLLTFGRANGKFVILVEKTLNDFVASDKKMQVLPYMPETRRKFVRDLCQVYRIDTQLVDQEPRRSVQVYRRIDSRIPSPLLSTSSTNQNVPSLGKLTDLRAPPSRPASTITKHSPGLSFRGWTSVVSPVPQTGLPSSAVPPRGRETTHDTPRRSIPPPVTGNLSPGNVPESWED